jgi:hypothetical protein
VTEAPTNTEILALWSAEVAIRQRRWIAGVPIPADLVAVERFVAHRLKTTPEAVREAVAEVRPATVPRETPNPTQGPNP